MVIKGRLIVHAPVQEQPKTRERLQRLIARSEQRVAELEEEVATVRAVLKARGRLTRPPTKLALGIDKEGDLKLNFVRQEDEGNTLSVSDLMHVAAK